MILPKACNLGLIVWITVHKQTAESQTYALRCGFQRAVAFELSLINGDFYTNQGVKNLEAGAKHKASRSRPLINSMSLTHCFACSPIDPVEILLIRDGSRLASFRQTGLGGFRASLLRPFGRISSLNSYTSGNDPTFFKTPGKWHISAGAALITAGGAVSGPLYAGSWSLLTIWRGICNLAASCHLRNETLILSL
jgi:hypothetical protein